MEDALRDALIEHKTAVVALEEVHNALTNEGKQFRSRMRNFLKNLWNFSPADDSLEWASASPGKFQRKLIVLVSGTSALKKVFEDDDELRTRYNNIVIANRLSISSPEEFKAFRMILIRFAIRFRLAMEYDFKSAEFAMRCYLGTGANMRAVERLFERAGTLSRRLRTSKQSVEQIFSSALKQVDESQSAIFDPFLETINIVKNTFSMELNRQEAAGEGLRK